MLYLTKLTEPASEPITVAELSAHLRLNDTTWEDALLTNWIKAARQDFEARTQRQVISCTYTLGVEKWTSPIYLPRSPIASVQSVKYYNSDGTLTTVDPSYYLLDVSRDMGMVRLLRAFNKPTVYPERIPIEVSFTAGWVNAAAVPQLIKQGLTLLAAEMYRSREALTDKTLSELPYGYQSICNLYKINFASELNHA